jgi:hypothetical protein
MDTLIYNITLDPHEELRIEKSTTSLGEEGWENGPILQTNAVKKKNTK